MNTELKTKIFESLGTASMCWSEIPTGVFESTLAQKIGDELVKAIKESYESPTSAPVEVGKTAEELAIRHWERNPHRNMDECCDDFIHGYNAAIAEPTMEQLGEAASIALKETDWHNFPEDMFYAGVKWLQSLSPGRLWISVEDMKITISEMDWQETIPTTEFLEMIDKLKK